MSTKKWIMLIVGAACLSVLIGYSVLSRMGVQALSLPQLSVSDKKLLTSEGHGIRLVGITSDYFRYGFNNDYPNRFGVDTSKGLNGEKYRLITLKQVVPSLNLIVLYLSTPNELMQNIKEIEEYLDFALQNGLYVALAPVGHSFNETNPNFTEGSKDDLTQFTKFLADRFGKREGILFLLAAEPDIKNDEWTTKQLELGNIVRKESRAPILVSTTGYNIYRDKDIIKLASLNNVIFTNGGYRRKNDHSAFERSLRDILGDQSLISSHPTIVIEFGGNYGGNFSTKEDLDLFKEIMEEINEKELSYSMYRLSSSSSNDELALFDSDNELTNKGAAWVSLSNKYD